MLRALGRLRAFFAPPAYRDFARCPRRSASVPRAPTYSNEKPRTFRRSPTTACQVDHSTGPCVRPNIQQPPTPPRDKRPGRPRNDRATPDFSPAAPLASRRLHPATNWTHTPTRSSPAILSRASEAPSRNAVRRGHEVRLIRDGRGDPSRKN